jgi:hypothetical protein
MQANLFTSIALQNVTAIARSFLNRHHSIPVLAQTSNSQQDAIQQFLNRILEGKYDMEHFKQESKPLQREETKEEFERKKRQLMILLDQAVQSKMKIDKAFGEKLKSFGPDARQKYGLGWHPGWYEPERYKPEMDTDPFRGACAASSCPCEMFVSWPVNLRDQGHVTNTQLEDKNVQYVYNPQYINPENELCLECHHPKSDHVLETKKDRSSLKEFSPHIVDKYGIEYYGMKKHPADIPMFELTRFYELNPEHPGANPDQAKLAITEMEDTPKKKGMASMLEDDLDDEW